MNLSLFRTKRNQPISDRGSLTENVVSLARQSINSHSYPHLSVSGMGSLGMAIPKSSNCSVVSLAKVQPSTVAVDSHSKSHLQPQEPSDASGPSQSTSLRLDTEDPYRQSRDTLAGKEPMPPR